MSRFLEIMDTNMDPGEIERLAKDIHEYYWERSKHPKTGWTPQPHLDCAYEDLSEDWKSDNRAAARRIPEVLELAGLYLEKVDGNQSSDELVPKVIAHYLELLAEAEHDGWQEYRVKTGWTLGERDDAKKRHPDLKPYRDLDEDVKKKDRDAIMDYPKILARAGYRIAHRRYEDEES